MRKRISYVRTEQSSMLPGAGSAHQPCWRGQPKDWISRCMLENVRLKRVHVHKTSRYHDMYVAECQMTRYM
jgi:hypothetical protein